jgi:hypothetical protein
MREPTLHDLALWVCEIQPELDEAAAVDLLMLPGIADWVALRWQEQRVTAESLLGLHLGMHGEPVA